MLKEIMPYLMKYSWPGNVRELLNFMERLSFFLEDYKAGTKGIDLLKNIVPEIIQKTNKSRIGNSLREQLDAKEEALITGILEKSSSMAEASARLGIGKTTLWRKIKKIQKEK